MFPKLHMLHQLLYFGKSYGLRNRTWSQVWISPFAGCVNLGTSYKFSEPFSQSPLPLGELGLYLQTWALGQVVWSWRSYEHLLSDSSAIIHIKHLAYCSIKMVAIVVLHSYSIIIHSNQNTIQLFNWYFYCYCHLSQQSSPVAKMTE